MTPAQVYYTLPAGEWATDLCIDERRCDLPAGYRYGQTYTSPAYNAIAIIRESNGRVLRVRLVPHGMETPEENLWSEIEERML